MKVPEMRSVLFVCTANICRSPMAMALWQAKVSGEAADWRIESAGTWAIEGQQAVAGTQAALQEKGLEVGRHRSRIVTAEILSSFNLILTMERGQKEAICAEFPAVAGRVYLLSEMVSAQHEILDPVGGSMFDFRTTLSEIDDILNRGTETIYMLAE